VKPFQQLRMWLRNGPPIEWALTSVAFLVVVGLVAWAAIPTSGGGSSATLGTFPPPSQALHHGGHPASGGKQHGGQAHTGGAPSAGGASALLGGTGSSGPSSSGGSGGSGGPSGTSGSSGPSSSVTKSPTPTRHSPTPGSGSGKSGGSGQSTPKCPAATNVPGVTNSTITVGVVVVDLGALNSLAGLASAKNEETAYQAVFNSINAHGGVACRKLVPKFYSDNVISASSEQTACLNIQQDNDFAVINNLYNPQTITCIPQAKIPNFWYTSPHVPTLRKYYPYILSWAPDYDRLIADYILGAKQVGWFKGTKKVGILDSTCYPDESTDIRKELTRAGYPSKTWSVYNYGCSTSALGEATSAQQTAAAVQFKNAGVNRVVSVAYDTTPGFAKAAQNQHYYPKYALMSDAEVQLTDHSTDRNPGSMNDALDITTDQVGGQDTAGYKFNSATKACDKVISKAGLPAPTSADAKTAGALEGVACVSTSMLVAAIENAPALNRSSLAAGLARAGRIDLGFPAGPAAFNADDPTGGEYWRTGAFHYGCNCWVVTSQKWRPGFTP
jgi:hypothetical protein